MSFARRELTSIAKDLGKSLQDVEGFISILEQNWYETQEALRSARVADLDALGVPQFLSLKLIEAASSSQQRIPVQYPPEETCRKWLLGMDKVFLTPEEKRESLVLLSKILKNIVESPQEARFRSLSLSNDILRLRLWRYREVAALFQEWKFESKEGRLFLPLESIKADEFSAFARCIESELSRTSHQGFNPYAAAYTSTTASFSLDKLSTLVGREDPVPLLTQETRLPQVVANPPEDSCKEAAINEEEEDISVLKTAVLSAKLRAEQASNFRRARRSEGEEDGCAEFKVTLPSNWWLHLRLAPNSTVGDLFQLVTDQLSVEDRYCLIMLPSQSVRMWSDNSSIAVRRLKDSLLGTNASLLLRFECEELNKSANILRLDLSMPQQ